MAHRVQISRAWCDECLNQCFFAHDEGTRRNQHLGPNTIDLAHKAEELKAKGYTASHRSGVYTYTMYKAAPLIPLEWQILAESKEPEYIQDW